MINLAGEQGQTLANEGVEAVRKVIEDTKAPPGVQAYVAGPAALTDDVHVIGNASLASDHADHPRRDRGHAAGGLPLDQHHADPALPDVPRIADRARGGLGAGHPWRLRADDVRRKHPDDACDRGGHRLRHLHLRPLSRRSRHGPGPRCLLLRHLQIRRTRHRRLGPDDRRRDVLPELLRGCPTSPPWAPRSRSA